MNTQILALLLALLLYPSASKAQFNTVRGNRPRCKLTAINEKEASPESDTSHVRMPELSSEHPVSSFKYPDTTKQTERTSHVSMIYPLRNIKITSPFGYRTDPFTGKRTMHSGIDLAAHNDLVFSMLPGTVEKVGYDPRSGNFVTVRHGDFRISYCHLSRILITQGSTVSSGTILGITGSTGRSTGEHLHITAKYKSKAFNPMAMLELLTKNNGFVE